MRSARSALILRWLLTIFFCLTGILHFVIPQIYLSIMPPYLPCPGILNAIAGFCEIAGGLGVILPSTRVSAGWGLIALLIAVFPANVQMLVNVAPGHPLQSALLWARLPLQILMILWVRSAALSKPQPSDAPSP